MKIQFCIRLQKIVANFVIFKYKHLGEENPLKISVLYTKNKCLG